MRSLKRVLLMYWMDGKGSSDPDFKLLKRALKETEKYLSSLYKDVGINVDPMTEHDIINVSLKGKDPVTLSTSVDCFIGRFPDNLQYVRTNLTGFGIMEDKLPLGYSFETRGIRARLFGTNVMHSPAKTY